MIEFELKENWGIVKASPTGWTKEVNIISWYGGPDVIDIREWDEDHLHMSKGLTLKMDEAKELQAILNNHLK